jgi:excisionase family DNA binding protein
MELMNKDEAAKYLRISVGGVNRRLARGELIPTRIGSLVFFRKETLDRFIRNCEEKGRRQARQRRENRHSLSVEHQT